MRIYQPQKLTNTTEPIRFLLNETESAAVKNGGSAQGYLIVDGHEHKVEVHGAHPFDCNPDNLCDRCFAEYEAMQREAELEANAPSDYPDLEVGR